MFAQIVNGRIVRLSEKKHDGDVAIDLPEDFDYDHIDRYEVTSTGIIKHDLPEEAVQESPYVTWADLEKALREGVNSV